MRWDDASHTLTIGERKGQFPGMLESRSFHVVFVSENHGVGVNPADEVDKLVRYSGRQVTVNP
jgi:alpha-D-xyloside xylohydrolase